MRWKYVEVTGGFLFLLAWINYCDTQRLLPITLCAAAIHEFGHWIAIRMVKGRITLLRLSAVGAQMQLEGTLSYSQEIMCALAGPMLNLAVALLSVRFSQEVFAGVNLVLGVFNLLPIGTLDGGRVIYCANAAMFGPEISCRVCKGISSIFSAGVSVAGMITCWKSGNLTLLLVACWLWNAGEK